MVDVQPLCGLKYASETVGDLAYVVSPPHDVVSLEEQVYYHVLSPYNILQVEWGRAFPHDNHINNRYTRSANMLTKWRNDGILVKDTTFRYYLYQQNFDVGGQAYTRMGLIARVRLESGDASAVLPHEHTMSHALHDRLNLLHATATNISPIMCLYDDPQGQIRELLTTSHVPQAEIQVRDKAGGMHLLYPITDQKHVQLIHDFFLTKQLYIADGHHRYETALSYREELHAQRFLPPDHPANFVLMTLIDRGDPGLVVLPIHRLVSSLRSDSMKYNDLTSVERRVIEDKGTERPFTGEYDDFYQEGTYICRRCNAPLYSSESKFNAHCGWPAFDADYPNTVQRVPDADGHRTEIQCANCHGHLGHAFTGERLTETNTRHCVNSLSMRFIPKGQQLPEVIHA